MSVFSLVGKTDVAPRKTPENQQTPETVKNVTKTNWCYPSLSDLDTTTTQYPTQSAQRRHDTNLNRARTQSPRNPIPHHTPKVKHPTQYDTGSDLTKQQKPDTPNQQPTRRHHLKRITNSDHPAHKAPPPQHHGKQTQWVTRRHTKPPQPHGNQGQHSTQYIKHRKTPTHSTITALTKQKLPNLAITREL